MVLIAANASSNAVVTERRPITWDGTLLQRLRSASKGGKAQIPG
jgi:hypothetical protein